jgi:hypothetical protein
VSSQVVFADLMSAVRSWTNTENQTGFLTDADIRRALNEGLEVFHEKLVAARGQEHIRKQWPITVVSTQAAYPLPPDFFELISIDIQVGPNQYISCRPYMEAERNAFRLYPGWSGWYMGLPVYFRIQGSTAYANQASPAEKTINFIPNSTSSFPVTLNYVYCFPRFDVAGSQDPNRIDSVNGWTNYAMWYAVALGKAKLKEDPSFAIAQREMVAARIQELAGQNAAGDAERIRDIESNDFETLGWWR